MKRTGTSKTTGKQYTYYCCEFSTKAATCDFMTWDVPVKDDCSVCGHTMFKRAGRGFNRPFCINAACENFLPEDKRGYPKKKTADEAAEKAEGAAPEKSGKTAKKAAAKTTAEKKPAAKKPAAKKTAAKKSTAKKTTGTKVSGRKAKTAE